MTTETTSETIDPAAELAAFKRQVRRLAIRIADEEGWCHEGLNEALEELGLAPYLVGTQFLGTTALTGTVVVPKHMTDAPTLTQDTVGDWITVASSVGDVEITAQRVTAFTSDEAGGGALTVEVDFAVFNTDNERTARRWTWDALALEYIQDYRVAPGEDQRIGEITWTDQITDPDNPNTY